MSNNEDKENSNIDLDSIKRQLLINQESYLKEQTQSGINDTEDNINKLIIDEQELKSKISTSDFFEYVIKAVKKTVKCEDVLIRQILLTGLSSYIEEDPINLELWDQQVRVKPILLKNVSNSFIKKMFTK